ncbi:MAG: hypothetical protein U9O94_03245 [Nanoarchaeota archaeon]|nr:hypothetical protein [Nanoarchaeota archaeon]
MAYLYIHSTSTGKGFITHTDRESIPVLSSQPCNIYVTTDNTYASGTWCPRVNGTFKTRDECLALWETQFDTTKSGMLDYNTTERNDILATTFSGYVAGITESLG